MSEQVKEVRKQGDYYVVQGRDSKGRETSIHVPSPSVEGLSREKANELFKRGIRNASEQR